MINIREEEPVDKDEIHALNQLAFDGPVEAELVDRLRAEGACIVSLVALEGGSLVGHILFSRVHIDDVPAASLAPMAVHPDHQRRGIGSALVRRGLDLCRKRGERACIVLGHSEYYPRFGFSRVLAEPLESPWSGCGPAWMALELVPGALEGVRGRVRYPAAFDGL